MLVPKQWQNVAQVLQHNRVKFPKDFFAIVLYTNRVAMMSGIIKEWKMFCGISLRDLQYASWWKLRHKIYCKKSQSVLYGL